MIEFVILVKKYLRLREMTIKDLHEELGGAKFTSQARLYRVCSGEQVPSLQDARAVAHVLNFSENDLLYLIKITE